MIKHSVRPTIPTNISTSHTLLHVLTTHRYRPTAPPRGCDSSRAATLRGVSDTEKRKTKPSPEVRKHPPAFIRLLFIFFSRNRIHGRILPRPRGGEGRGGRAPPPGPGRWQGRGQGTSSPPAEPPPGPGEGAGVRAGLTCAWICRTRCACCRGALCRRQTAQARSW